MKIIILFQFLINFNFQDLCVIFCQQKQKITIMLNQIDQNTVQQNRAQLQSNKIKLGVFTQQQFYLKGLKQAIVSHSCIFDNNQLCLKQGTFNYIGYYNSNETFQENQPYHFKDILCQLKNGDFSTLKLIWNQNFTKKIDFMVKHWQQFMITSQENFMDLIKVFFKNMNLFAYRQGKIEDITKFYNYFYQNLFKTIQKINLISDLMQRQSFPLINRAQSDKENLINNNMMKLFLRQQQMQANKKGVCYIDTKSSKRNEINSQQIVEQQGFKKNNSQSVQGQQIGKYIVDNNVFGKNSSEWKSILDIATVIGRYSRMVTHSHNQIDKVYQFSQENLNFNQLSQPIDRLCCSQFFYFGIDIYPSKRQTLLTRKKIFIINLSKDKNKNIKDNLKQLYDSQQLEDIMLDICGLLNSGGGVQLFSCQSQYLQIRAIGEILLQSDKQKYKQILSETIKKVYPPIQIENEIRISFVPLVKHPFDIGYKKETYLPRDKQLNRNYIKGLYVMRIVVTPSQNEQVYCYEREKNQYKSALIQNNQRIILKGNQLMKYMNKKYSFFQQKQQEEQNNELLRKQYVYMHKHQCLMPYQGQQLEVKQSLKAEKNNKKKFQHVSLLVANKKYFDIIYKKLQAKGIECQIDNTFQGYDLKGVINSAPIYHNIRFDQLLSKISYNPQFVFDKRPVVIINVTHCLKLKDRIGFNNRLPFQSFINLQKWLHKQFPIDQLQYWIIKDDENIQEHYLRTNNKSALIFMYYVLHKFEEKSIFKNPGSSQQENNKQYRKKINQRAKKMYKSVNNLFFDNIQ